MVFAFNRNVNAKVKKGDFVTKQRLCEGKSFNAPNDLVTMRLMLHMLHTLHMEIMVLPSSAPAPTSTELEAELVIFSCLYNHPPNHPGEFKFDLIWYQYQNKSCFIC